VTLQSSVRTKSGPLTAIYKTYKGGGYVVSLGRTYERARDVLTELRSLNWLDQLTRAVIVDFSLYNANTNLFVAVTLSFEMTSMGSVIQDHQIKVFRLYDHIGGYGFLVYSFELIFTLFTVYSLVHEIILIGKQRREYFDKFWNIISLITAVFSVTSIGMYGTKKTLTRLAIRSLRKNEMGKSNGFHCHRHVVLFAVRR
jgi:nitrate reductase NapE component